MCNHTVNLLSHFCAVKSFKANFQQFKQNKIYLLHFLTSKIQR